MSRSSALIALLLLGGSVVADPTLIEIEVRGGPDGRDSLLPKPDSSKIALIPAVHDQSPYVTESVRNTLVDLLRGGRFRLATPEEAEFHLLFDFGTETKKEE